MRNALPPQWANHAMGMVCCINRAELDCGGLIGGRGSWVASPQRLHVLDCWPAEHH
jgi:hypothetical protein